MAIDKETRILKSNTIEQFRQKANEVSLHLGDTDQLNSLIADNVFDYSNVSVGTDLVQGSDDNSLIQKFNVKPDESLDNTGGYIILKGSPTIPSSFVADAVVTQSGGFSATIVSVSTTKILVKNSSGTFNAAQNLVIGSDNIANSAVVRLITESYNVGNIRVFKNGTELPQDLSANGFHVPALSGVITLTGSPALAGYEEGTTISQSGGFSATVLKATSTALFLKVQSGTYSVSQNITGGDAAIVAAKHTGISSKDIAFGNAIELNTITANASDDIQIKATSTVQALNELQDDIGNIANLGTSADTDLVVSINELETGLRGNLNNYNVTTTNTSDGVVGAVNELHVDIGTASFTNDLPSHTTYNTSAPFNLTDQIENIVGFIGNTAIDNIHGSTHTITQTISKLHSEIGNMTLTGLSATTLSGAARELRTELGDVTALNTSVTSNVVGAINEIEGVFDASARTITTSGDLTIDSSGDIILDADGGDVILKDGGTQFGKFTNNSGSLHIVAHGSDNDIKVFGNDGGSSVTALHLDMSDAGTAIFNHDIKIPDDGIAKFGADADLEIYHLSSNGNSVIKESGGGSLSLQTNGSEVNIYDTTNAQHMAQFQTGGAVSLRHNGSEKFITKADGVDITGELQSDSLDVDGAGDISGNLTIGGILDIGTLSTQFSVSNRNNVKLALNELHSELGNAVITGTNTAASGLTNLTAAINAIDAEIGVTNTILNNSGNHSSTTVVGVLGNLSTAITGNDTDISALQGRDIIAGDGLTGGGTLAEDRTLSVGAGSGITVNADDVAVDATVLRTTSTNVVRTDANRNIVSGTTVTFDSGSSLIVNGTLTLAGSASGVSTFGVNFVEVDGSGNQQGLQVQNSFSGYSVDPRVQWNHTRVSAAPTRAWQLVGLAADGSTADTTDIVTYTNFGDLADGTHLEKSGTSLRIKDEGVTLAKIQHISANRLLGRSTSGSGDVEVVQVKTAMIEPDAITGAKIADDSINSEHLVDGSVDNVHLANDHFTITDGDGNATDVALNQTLTIQGTANEIEVVENSRTVTVGLPSNVTIGNNLVVAGNLQVDGDTTTLNTATLNVEDLNITVAKNATTSSAANTSGLTFGAYAAAATLTYSHSGTKLVSNKDVEATRFLGPVTGNVTGNADTATALATSRNFSISGDATASAVSFDGSGNVDLNVNIDANTVGINELNVTDGSAGQVLETDGSGNLSFGTVSTTNNFITGLSFNTGNGILTATRNGLSNLTVDLDGRFSTTDTVDMGDGFVIEDSDGTEVVITENKEIKFVGGDGIGINFTDTSTGSDGDPFDLTFTIPTGGVTHAMLGGDIVDGDNIADDAINSEHLVNGSVDNVHLANSSITINGSAISLGGSVTTPNDNTITQIRRDNTGTYRTGNINLVGGSNVTISEGSAGVFTIASTDTNTVDMGDGFVIEDGDGTEVVITENKEVKFRTNNAITINWTDTSTGSDADPYDLTFGIANDSITNAMMADDSIGTAQLIATAVGTAELADTAVTEGKIANGAVTNGKLGASAVSTAKIADLNVTTAKIEALAVTTAKIAAGAVTTAKLHNNNVTNASVSGSTLTLTRQGVANVTHGPFDNYSNWEVTDGTTGSSVGSGQAVTFAAGTGLTVSQSGRTITYTPNLNTISGVRLEDSGGSLIDNVDKTGIGQRITLKEGTNIDLQNSGGEIVINGPDVDNANNLTQGTLNKARLDNDLRGAINHIGSTSGNTFVNFNSSTDMRFTVNNQENARLEADGDFHVRNDLVAVASLYTSDERLKEDIHRVEGALELVSQLDGVTFKWKEDGRQSAGVIAQNVEKVLPSAVHEVDDFDKSDKHKVVDYNQLSALLIEAIKELKEQNKELKDEIEVLKNINSNS